MPWRSDDVTEMEQYTVMGADGTENRCKKLAIFTYGVPFLNMD